MRKENLEPKPNVEYIYNHDTAFPEFQDDTPRKIEDYTVDVTLNRVVEDLVFDDDCYKFKFKGEDQLYHSYYGWAFVENTPVNIELLKQIDEQDSIIAKHAKQRKELYAALDRLHKVVEETDQEEINDSLD